MYHNIKIKHSDYHNINIKHSDYQPYDRLHDEIRLSKFFSDFSLESFL